MNFDQKETKRQAGWKKSQWSNLPPGIHKGRSYDHILPEGEWKKNLYPATLQQLLEYCSNEKIHIHSGMHNLKSSQACCFNIMFPLHLDLDLAAKVLAPVFPGLKTVEAVEFEYTGLDGTTEWLGEPESGGRGMNRTSIDAAISWKHEDGRKIMSLCEWKYTEKGFGDCGGYKSSGNDRKDLCETIVADNPGVKADCYLTKGRNTRKYWDHMQAAGIELSRFMDIPGCPFRGPFYQLMRQYLLAAFLRTTNQYDEVEVVSLSFKGNNTLTEIPDYLKPLGSEVYKAWNAILAGVPLLKVIYVEDIAAMLAEDGDPNHYKYVQERYGL